MRSPYVFEKGGLSNMAKINMDDLAPNSNTYKNKVHKEKETVTPIKRRGSIVTTKKPLSKKLWDLFVGEDPKDIKDYMINDVLIPGLKNAVLDTISMGFFGETISRSRNSSGYRSSRTSYSSIYKGRKEGSSRLRERKKSDYEENDKVDYRNIILDNKTDAEEVVDYLKDRIERAGSVSVAELFDVLELPSRFTDNDWGWKDELDIGMRRVNSGYLIDVAEVIHLE